jgi:heme-degrading monooxygenase HmoA
VAPEHERTIVTVFRSRLRADATQNGYPDLAARLEARARAMPGFVDFKSFAAPDGERVSVVVFDSWEHHDAWRDDTEHREAQRRGRERFYASYAITVCESVRRVAFLADPVPEPVRGPEPS